MRDRSRLLARVSEFALAPHLGSQIPEVRTYRPPVNRTPVSGEAGVLRLGAEAGPFIGNWQRPISDSLVSAPLHRGSEPRPCPGLVSGSETRVILSLWVDRLLGAGQRIAFSVSADSPSCMDCGSIMVRNGSCYKCLNCGATSGCS